jgi:hypothetical protein
MHKSDVDAWQKLEPRAKKLETALKSARIRKPSHVYFLVANSAPEEVMFVLYRSTQRPVQERLRNYFQKYLPAVQEITSEEWAAVDAKAGSRRNKARDEFITDRLDRRRPVPPPPPPVVEPPRQAVRGRPSYQ